MANMDLVAEGLFCSAEGLLDICVVAFDNWLVIWKHKYKN